MLGAVVGEGSSPAADWELGHLAQPLPSVHRKLLGQFWAFTHVSFSSPPMEPRPPSLGS